MQVNLVSPPYWTHTEPYLAIPALVGHLKSRGVTTRVLDLNILTVDRLLSSDFMDECVARLHRRLAAEPAALDVNGTPLRSFLAAGEIVARQLSECKATLRRECDPLLVAPARGVLDHAMEVVSAAFTPSSIDRGFYCHAGAQIMDMGLVRQLSADGATNIFGALMEQGDVDKALEGSPDLVGLSLTGQNQLVPAMTLVRRLKARAPDVPIALGGALAIHLYEVAQRHPNLFEGVDFMVVGEGETALTHLLEAMAGARPMETVENLIFRKDGQFLAGQLGYAEDVNELATPDFEGMPWEMYLSPVPIVPYMSSRGCYWDRCSFCSLCATVMNSYRTRNIDKVIGDLRQMTVTEQVGRRINFTDECVSPRRLRLLSRALLESDLKLEWDIMARFEKPFKAEDFALAAEAGLDWIAWGLESASPSVLEAMNKGIRPAAASRLLGAASDAGIWNHVFVVYGFPGETDEDYLETRAFVRQNVQHIDSLTDSIFRLEKGSAISRDWQERGIVPVETASTFVGPIFPFEYVAPLSHERVLERAEDFKAFLQLETHLSTTFTEGFPPPTIGMLHFNGKLGLRRLLEERGAYFQTIFQQDGWHRGERFRFGGHSSLPSPVGHDRDKDLLLLAEATGRIVVVNGSGMALLGRLASGDHSLFEALRALCQGRDPTEAELASALRFVRQLLWRGLLEPTGDGALPQAPWRAPVRLPGPDPAVMSTQ